MACLRAALKYDFYYKTMVYLIRKTSHALPDGRLRSIQPEGERSIRN